MNQKGGCEYFSRALIRIRRNLHRATSHRTSFGSDDTLTSTLFASLTESQIALVHASTFAYSAGFAGTCISQLGGGFGHCLMECRDRIIIATELVNQQVYEANRELQIRSRGNVATRTTERRSDVEREEKGSDIRESGRARFIARVALSQPINAV